MNENLSANQFKTRFKYTKAENNTSGYSRVEAIHKGQVIGNLDWDGNETGRTNMIYVDEEHRRKGVATALWNQAHKVAWDKDLTAPRHARRSDMSADGLAWSKKVK
jgi:GNAT superfamily N-acetyltransferase